MTRAIAVVFALVSSSVPAAPVLSGTVTSQEEGPMEGVLVSAQAAGSPITITVVTDAKGNYAFPEGKLKPGTYAIRIRAAGYDHEGMASVQLADKPATQPLRLKKTADLAA